MTAEQRSQQAISEADLTAGDACLPPRQTMNHEAYLISRGVRPVALIGHCPPDPLVMVRVRTRLHEARDGLDVLTFVLPDHSPGGHAAFGYASHRWAVNLLAWLYSGEVPRPRVHEILGLLLGYSAPAIGRHQESDGLWEFDFAAASPEGSQP